MFAGVLGAQPLTSLGSAPAIGQGTVWVAQVGKTRTLVVSSLARFPLAHYRPVVAGSRGMLLAAGAGAAGAGLGRAGLNWQGWAGLTR